METTNFFKESLKFDEKRKEESKIVRNLFITRLRNNLKGQARFIREEIYIDEDDRKEAVLIVQRLLNELSKIEKEGQPEQKDDIERLVY